MSLSSFNVVDRQREKSDSRLRDEARLVEGREAVHELAERNGFFSAFDPSRARVVARRVRLPSA